MLKKLFSMAILTAMIFALGATAPVMAAGTDADVVFTLSESNVYCGNGGFVANKDANPAITPHSGSYYLAMPGDDDYLSFGFDVPEGGDDANYILSFYAKTSLEKSLCVETVPQVKDENGAAMSWADYRIKNNLPYITSNNIENMSYMITGVNGNKGGEWIENRLEFRVPEDCNFVRIYFNVHFNNYQSLNSSFANFVKKADDYRAIDTVTIEKAPYNLIKNGGFESRAYDANGITMPYSGWRVSYNTFTIEETDGNSKAHFSGAGGNWNAAPTIEQTVYLYPGKYVVSYDVEGTGTQGKVLFGFSNVTADDTLMGTKYPFAAVSDNRVLNHTHVGYLTVNRAAGYKLQINNGYLGGNYYFDNFKLVPLDTKQGDLKFGKVGRTMDGNGANGNNWVPTSNNLLFETDLLKSYTAGEKIKAFGLIPTDGTATSAQVLTSVYKVSANGNRVLAEVKIDSAVPGQGFKGSEVTIPTLASGETVEVKAMVLNSLGELKAFGKDFILE